MYEKKSSQHGRDAGNAMDAGGNIAPGKVTRTGGLALSQEPGDSAPPRRNQGAVPPADAAAEQARHPRSARTAAWLDTAMRPDLYPPPDSPPGPHQAATTGAAPTSSAAPVQAKGAPSSSTADAAAGDDVRAPAGEEPDAGHADLVQAAAKGQWHVVTRGLKGIGEMAALLAAIDAIEQAGALEGLWAYALEYDWNDGRLTAALHLVRTIGRGDRSLGAIVQINSAMAGLSDAEKRALVAYAARRVATSSDTEALLALVDSPEDAAEAAVVANAPGPVAKGPWQKPGEQPANMYVGNAVHDAIAQYYLAHHTLEAVFLNTRPISAILQELARMGTGPASNLAAKAKGDFGLRPDITNASLLELFEIKPAGALAQGQAEMSYYLSIFHGAGVPMKPGTPGSPGTQGVVPAPGGHVRFYAPVPGVILYRYQHGDFVPVPQMQAQEQEQVQAQESHAPGWWRHLEEVTGFTGVGLLIYLILSEGSRIVIPPRNAIPVL